MARHFPHANHEMSLAKACMFTNSTGAMAGRCANCRCALLRPRCAAQTSAAKCLSPLASCLQTTTLSSTTCRRPSRCEPATLDLTAGRNFGMLCCVAGLWAGDTRGEGRLMVLRRWWCAPRAAATATSSAASSGRCWRTWRPPAVPATTSTCTASRRSAPVTRRCWPSRRGAACRLELLLALSRLKGWHWCPPLCTLQACISPTGVAWSIVCSGRRWTYVGYVNCV